ncbi:SDR family oxidoreductase [Hyphomicrobium sp. LHD-15]|uniref:SDR family oxidoreductase n=1 Tax=Hyphomicrobium sp. LHD-15 TaxID=3072142 RepID=UPI00280F6923|nr:SDR family oxidoreductase [Hyphomicrobium sp. LHD-15]MDQ8698816.1 SDR family oxidoreductase [Hyphomicrobium sp. LHD-15]
MKKLFCFGLGYSAEALARRLSPAEWQITGTARSDDGVERIAALGYGAIRFDGHSPAPEATDALADATHVLISASPDELGDPVLRLHGGDLANAASLGWIGYLSTIGVYGNSDGQWIDETATPKPGVQRTKRRLEAEADWLTFAETHGKRVQVFRLGGIYGPGRSAIDDLRDGTARRIVKPGQVFNRIHVDDIATVLLAAANGAGRHTIYNVTDDEPSPSQDVIAYAADLMGLEPPPEIPFEQAELTPMGRSFYADNRRVSNRRLHDDLGVTLRFPTYREGMAGIFAGT